MHPAGVPVGGDNAAIGGKCPDLPGGRMPLPGNPVLVLRGDIVVPMGREALHQADAEDLLKAGIRIETIAFMIDFKYAEMDGFGNEAKALFALLERYLGIACFFLLGFQRLDAVFELKNGCLVRHADRLRYGCPTYVSAYRYGHFSRCNGSEGMRSPQRRRDCNPSGAAFQHPFRCMGPA